MTKYEWESDLKQRIRRLPESEINRVLDYYGELFDDKIERGATEREVIAEFGNPRDAAEKILYEYYADADRYEESPRRERRAEPRRDVREPKREERGKGYEPRYEERQKTRVEETTGVRGWMILPAIILGAVAVTLTAALWGVLIAVCAGGAACALGGTVGFVPSGFMIFDNLAIALVQFAACFAVLAVGVVLLKLTPKFGRVCVGATRGMFRGISNMLTKKKKVTYYEG